MFKDFNPLPMGLFLANLEFFMLYKLDWPLKRVELGIIWAEGK